MKRTFLLICTALAACAEVVEVAEPEAAAPPPPPFSPRQPEVSDSTDPCFAGSYLDLIGRQADTVGIAESETFRYIRLGSEPATEFVPERLNAVVEPNGMISQVYCG